MTSLETESLSLDLLLGEPEVKPLGKRTRHILANSAFLINRGRHWGAMQVTFHFLWRVTNVIR